MLLIDADPQGSLTASLGYVEPDEIGTTLATIMMAIINEKEFEITDGILHHKENVDLLPANIELSALEVTMGNVMSRELIMKEYIEAVRTKYDYILIDCMPSLGLMTINALVAADSVLIPVQAAYLPVKGLQQLIHTIAMVKKRLNRQLVFERYMGADASDFVYEVVKHFLMEALSRIYRPGCKADEMLCLVGQQGAGKSTFFRFLALNDDWFSDDLKQLNDSKIYEHLRGHWIMEMSEMIAAISAKSNEEIKSFLTRQKDTYRNPYDKYEEDRKRQCIFAGSTNTRQFIPFDRTGARRFLPIAIDSSKAEKHILDDEKEARSYFDQLWAEAMEIYWSTENKSSLLKFSKEMEQEISEYRKQFTQEDTMAGMIQGCHRDVKGIRYQINRNICLEYPDKDIKCLKLMKIIFLRHHRNQFITQDEGNDHPCNGDHYRFRQIFDQRKNTPVPSLRCLSDLCCDCANFVIDFYEHIFHP